MSTQWSLQDAKNKFSEVVKAALAGSPQLVTRRGQPAVMVVSVETYSSLLRCEQSAMPDFSGFLLSMPRQGDADQSEERADLRLREVSF